MIRNIVVLALFAIGLIVSSCLFIVEEGTRALILRFGQVERNKEHKAALYRPGLHFKLPLIEKVKIMDSRIQTIDNKSDRFTTNENKDLIVDSYLKWQITDFDTYYVATSGGNLALAQTLLKNRLNNNLRAAIGCKSIKDIVIDSRGDLMLNVHNALNGTLIKKADESTLTKCEQDMNVSAQNSNIHGMGVKIIDLRIKQMNLPDEVSKDIYNRMREERGVVAQLYRSRGESEARKIRARADYTVTVMLAEAEKQARVLHGEGDSQATALFTSTFKYDVQFYDFIRSLKAYENSFVANRDAMIVNTEEDSFFRYLTKMEEQFEKSTTNTPSRVTNEPREGLSPLSLMGNN